MARQARFGGRRNRHGLAQQQAAAAAEIADFLDQLAAEFGGSSGLARGRGLGDIIGGTKRQRAQRDFGAAARDRRRHDHHQIALLLQEQRQRRNAVKLGHFDIEHDDVDIAAFDPVDGLTPGAQRRGDRHVRFAVDPARHQAARDDRIVHDHDADRFVGGNRTVGGSEGDTHGH